MNKRTWLPPLICIAVITAMSNAFISATAFKGTVGKTLPIRNGQEWFDGFWTHYWWVFVKGFHFLEFALLFFLVWRALRDRVDRAQAIWASVGIACAFAAMDEFHQSFISYRGGRWTDVLIDCSGVAVCAVLIAWNTRRNTCNPPHVGH